MKLSSDELITYSDILYILSRIELECLGLKRSFWLVLLRLDSVLKSDSALIDVSA